MSRYRSSLILLFLLFHKSSGSAAPTTTSTALSSSSSTALTSPPKAAAAVSNSETTTANNQNDSTATTSFKAADAPTVPSPPLATTTSSKARPKSTKTTTAQSTPHTNPPSEGASSTTQAATPPLEQKSDSSTTTLKTLPKPTSKAATTTTTAATTAMSTTAPPGMKSSKPATATVPETATSPVATTAATAAAAQVSKTAAAASSSTPPPPPLTTKSSASSTNTGVVEREASNSLVDWWLDARCGNHRATGQQQQDSTNPSTPTPALWIYQGRLLDPLLGKEIAHVQGIEIVQRVNSTTLPLESSSSSEACRTATIKSRKLFCYTPPNDDDDDRSLVQGDPAKRPSQNILQSIRLRPGSKSSKRIPLQQAVSVYDSTITLLTRKSKKQKDAIVYTQLNHNDDAESNNNNKVDARRILWARAKCSCTRDEEDDGRKVLSVSLYAQPPPPIKQASKVLSDIIKQFLKDDNDDDDNNNNNKNAGTTTLRPRRAALVQFGPQQQQQQQRRGSGAMETYQYTITDDDNVYTYLEYEPSTTSEWIQRILLGRRQRVPAATSPPTVRYTRYGEGPVWYGPGRPCALELTGKQITDKQQIPPVLAKTISNHLPDFFSAKSTNIQESNNGSQRHFFLQQWGQHLQHGSVAAWNKIRQATSIQTINAAE